MSVKRRLVAAGMPAAGVTVFAVLALTGQPASAASVDSSVLAAQHVAVAGATPSETCEPGARVKCDGYGETDDNDYGKETPTEAPTAPDDSAGGEGDADNGNADNGNADDGNDSGSGAGDNDGRGNDGYGGEKPTTSPTPGGGKNEEPGGELPETVSPTGSAPRGNTDELPVTGPPVAALTTVGALLAAAGAAIMFGMRRRRSA